MLYPTTPEVLHRRRMIVAGVASALLLVGVVTYAVLAHGSTSPVSPPSDDAVSAVTPTSGPEQRAELAPLTPTSDPEAFARQVTHAIFAWDTTSMVSRADHVEQLLAVADPSGESTAGLLGDLDNYLPTTEAWAQLAQYETQQWLTITSVTTPTLWSEAESQAGHGLLPGTTAFTVDGVRHRSGVWEGEPISSSHGVAFTIFMVCGPSYLRCHLLRLSMLDKPLD